MPFSELNTTVPLPDKRPFPDELQTVGNHIKYARLSRNILIKDVCTLLQIDRETLRGWELDQFKPFVRHYPAIINFLGYFPFEQETESLGGKIKLYRFKNGLTQDQFGEFLTTDRSTVSQWENNKCIPIPCTKEKILELIGNL